MKREWLEKFYTECGREVALAYNVLNHSNNWGVTLAAAVLATSFMGGVEVKEGKLTVLYPTAIHWIYAILAWIIMLRFFTRSALGLANMYRWNEMIFASSKVLSLPQGHPSLLIYERNCAKKIDAYYYRWRSPLTRRKLIWHNLKLMYLWFFLIVLALIIWGAIALERNWLYYVGIGLFIVPTILESVWFMRWNGLEYEEVELEKEPDVTQLWQEVRNTMGTDTSRTLILGFCEGGPYKHARALLENPAVTWLPWSYRVRNISPIVLGELSIGFSPVGRRVAFACWPADFAGDTTVLRYGRIDHFSFTDGVLRVTVLLEDKNTNGENVSIDDPKQLCFYLTEQTSSADLKLL